MSRRFLLDRRAVLRGLLGGGAVSVALPPLEAMFDVSGRAYACDGVIPKRFGVFFWGNGNRPERWLPAGEGSDWQLSEQLAPLAAVQHKITVVSGMAVKVDNIEPHWSGCAGLLCGVPWIEEKGEDGTFGGPTIDQIIAAEIGGETLYRSIQVGATSCDGVSFNGPFSRNPPETDPFAYYERLFGDTFREPGEEGVIDPAWGLRRSALDAVMDQITDLQARLGAADRARLDQHLEGVRELEQRLATLEEDPPNLESCARPQSPSGDYGDVDGRAQIPARSRIMADMMAMTLACDQTRVFGFYLTDPLTNVLFSEASAGHHDLTHDESGDQPEVNQITLECVTEFAYLLEALDAVPEGDGTLLDNCAILGTSEVSEGQTHSIEHMPIVIAGGGCGALRAGLHYRSDTLENSNKVMLSLVRAMDITASSFGEGEGYTDVGLGDIEA